MFSVRLHGRGGQGVVTAAELLSVAAFRDGHEALAFPSFGSERMGAPVVAYCRISDGPIRSREPVTTPDLVLVSDATLLHDVDVCDGLRAGGVVCVNTVRAPAELGLAAARVVAVAASDIARTHLGRPMPNPVLLGAAAEVTGMVSLDALADAFMRRFPGAVGSANAAAVAAGAEAAREVARA